MNIEPNTILRAFVVQEPADDESKPYFHRVGTAFPHRSGKGFSLVIPDGMTVSGRIVCLPMKADEPTVAED